MDCGPSCLKMISSFHGKDLDITSLREICFIGKNGTSFSGISEGAEKIGLNSLPVLLDFESLSKEVPLPCIAHWQQRHFVTVYEVNKENVIIGDPGLGIVTYSHEEFKRGWLPEGDANDGYLLLLEPVPNFYDLQDHIAKRNDFRFLWQYFKGYKKELVQLIIGVLFASLLQLILPFLTQAVVDYGISYNDLNFVYLILIAQVVVFVSMSSVSLIRGWILLYLTQKVNIRLISDFLMKLMRLPISFFDAKHSGDIIQRINDNRKLQEFLSSSSLLTLFSIFTILVFSVVLLHYNLLIFLVFITGAVLYIGWALLFLKKLIVLDNQRFLKESDHQRSIWQLVTGMNEIKLNGSELKRRWEWEGIQIKLFKISSQHLGVTQRQDFGSLFINQLTNIIIVFISAKLVINGSLTLGAMLSIQFILGQLNLPLRSIIGFVSTAQEAKLSLTRMNEIHSRKEEETEEIEDLPTKNKNIMIQHLNFRYGPPSTPEILKDFSLVIEENKTTAIVGASGSGKTTLLKLLLRFYDSYTGQILINNTDLKKLSVSKWRKECSAVMQDGFIFEDSVLSNITESEKETEIDKVRLSEAIKVSNLEDFIENLPSGYRTIVGSSGLSLSGGEKQRILIARAVYKNPSFLFFDEATSALDANNEHIIMENLRAYYEGRTVMIIAHRLSTVRDADKIVVLEKGKIIEKGNHEDLIKQKGNYYTLVKNQLNLGK